MHHTIKRQITVALENQPGNLAAVCQMLAGEQINIEAISVIDSIEQGVVRIVASSPARCLILLRQMGLYVIEADIIVIELSDQMGLLALVSRELAAAGVNIDYLYGSSDHPGRRARLILKVSDTAKAQKILAALHVE